MWQIVTAMVLSQAAAPVKIVNPVDQSKAATLTTVGSKNGVDVNLVNSLVALPVIQGPPLTDGGSWPVTCTNCSGGGAISVDGGRLTADEGVGPDGGVWSVNVVNFPATQAVSAASLPLPAGAATEATLLTRTKPADQQHAIIDSSASIAVTGPLTDTQLRATPVPISGTVTATGTVAATQSGTWTVQPGNTANTTAWKVDGSAVTQPVSGTVTANAGTNLNTSSLELDATAAALNLGQASTTSGQTGPLVQGATTTSAPTYVTAKTNPLSLTTTGNLRVDGSSVTQPISGTVTANAGSGTMAVSAASLPLPTGAATETTLVTLSQAQASTTSGQNGPLVQGATTTGAPTYVTAKSNPLSLTTTGNLRVDGSSVTQPVSAVSLPLPAGASTAAKQPALGTAGSASADVISVQGVASMTALKVDGSGVTQPVSGTVTANAGTNLNTSALALDATLTGRTQKAQITDGTRDGTVKAASTAAQAADTSVVVGLSPNSPLPTGSNVIGHTISDTGSTTAVTGNVTAVQATGTNLHAVLDTTSTTAVTQATGTNLHAVLDATSTTAVTQATGTNLHAVLDATSTTAATQATAANLNAQVQGAGASGAAKSGNPVQTGAVFNTTQPTVTTGQGVETQATARGALIIATGVDAVTVTANAGTNLNTSALALSAPQTDRTQKSQITDGTRDGTVKASSTAAQAADTSLVVGLSPNSPLPSGTNALGSLTAGSAVIGHTINDTGSTTAVTGNVTAVQPTGTNLHVVTDATSVLAANQSVNAAQFGGTNVSTGTGAGGAGIPRVTVSNDSTVGLVAGSAVIGHVIADTGSTTACTQATGTNLHAVLDTTSTTACTQATGTNLHTVVDSAPTTAVTNAGLTNLDVALSTRTKPADQQHTIIDSSATIPVTLASTTITGTVADNVTQFGGTNVSTGTGASGAGIPRVTISNDSSLAANQSINVAQVGGTNIVTGGVAGIAAVGGNVANGSTATANPVPVGGVFTTTPTTLTTGQTATMQFTAAQNLKHDVTTVGGIDPALTTASLDAAATRRLLEEILEQSKRQTLILETLHSPGASP